eukprot:scaffold1448_cov387-Prasinococcus_capsulatus_cf.AAC.9
MMVANTLSICAGLGLAFHGSWQVTLVSLSCTPLLGISTYVQGRAVVKGAERVKELYQNASLVFSDAVANIRIVVAFTAEDRVTQLYEDALALSRTKNVWNAVSTALGFGFSQSLTMAVYAVVFYYGAYLIQKGELTFGELMQVWAIMFAPWAWAGAPTNWPVGCL